MNAKIVHRLVSGTISEGKDREEGLLLRVEEARTEPLNWLADAGALPGCENGYISQARITVSCTSRSSSGVTESGFFNRTASSSSAKSSTKRR